MAMSGSTTFVTEWPAPIDKEGSCSICRNEKKIRPVLLQCGHTYCNPCLQDAMANQDSNPTCPYCRADIYEYISLESNRIRRPRDKTNTDPTVIFRIIVSGYGAPVSPDPDYVPPSRVLTPQEEDAETFNINEQERNTPPSDALTSGEEEDLADARHENEQQLTLEDNQVDQAASQSQQTQGSSGSSVVYLYTVQPSNSTQSQPIDLSNGPQPGTSSGDPQNSPPGSRTSQRQQPPLGCGMRISISYLPIVDIESHRGLGRSIRYLVVWEDGSKTWEPTRHLEQCQETLKKYRRRLKVKHQQAYRRRQSEQSRA